MSNTNQKTDDIPMMFLGHPMAFWARMNQAMAERGTEDLLVEMVPLRGKVSFYENRIEQIHGMVAKLA